MIYFDLQRENQNDSKSKFIENIEKALIFFLTLKPILKEEIAHFSRAALKTKLEKSYKILFGFFFYLLIVKSILVVN